MSSPSRSFAGLARRVSALLLFASAYSACPATGDSCGVVTIDIPVAVADTFVLAYETRGYGQVFLAPDTLVHAISAWRPSVTDFEWLPWQVVVTEVDAGGRPDVSRIVRHGPILVVPPGDGVNPVEYRFVFDPPLALPRRGSYFADFYVADCFGIIHMLASNTNPYSDGQVWFTFGNRYACGYPTHPEDRGGNLDLAFRVEFCGGTTGTRHPSWGQIKVIYR